MMRGAIVEQDSGRVGAETVGDRLRRARRHRFVGRAAELELFREALDAPEPPFTVLFVHGPGGVGKTALLDELALVAEEAEIEGTRLDLRAIEPSPAAFRAALAQNLGLAEDGSPESALRAAQRRVLFLDTYEVAPALDGWLRESLLPQLPDRVLVVIAGRNPPSPEWLADPGWRELLRVIPVRNLRPEEARAYLVVEGVEEGLHDRALDATHGHPLALSLFVDVLAQRSAAGDPRTHFELADAPDAVGQLLERFVSEVPGPRHRRALEVCAHARFTTEDLLRAATDGGGAAELFEWLRGLSFVDEGPLGVFPHDLARDVLDADLRWRSPEAYVGLHHRIRSHLIDRARRREGSWGRIDAEDLLFMHRRSPLLGRFLDWSTFGSIYGDRLRPGDREEILALAERYEGSESAAIVELWLERQPQAFVAFREGEDVARGFTAMLALHQATDADRDADPGARAMWDYVQRYGAARPGEGVFAARFLIDRNDYQGTAALNVISVVHTQSVLSRPGTAWDFIGPWADPERIEPVMSYIDFHRAPEADYEVGGRRYGVFAHDWRRVDLGAWLELTESRELDDEASRPIAEQPAPVIALSQPEFADAVRVALRNLHQQDALAANPLLRSRAAADRGGERPSPEALRDLIAEAIDSLRADPRDEKLHRALARTYVRPAQTQELAAEALGLPFSTYRRHLTRGIERVTEWLWQRELYGPEA